MFTTFSFSIKHLVFMLKCFVEIDIFSKITKILNICILETTEICCIKNANRALGKWAKFLFKLKCLYNLFLLTVRT